MSNKIQESDLDKYTLEQINEMLTSLWCARKINIELIALLEKKAMKLLMDKHGLKQSDLPKFTEDEE